MRLKQIPLVCTLITCGILHFSCQKQAATDLSDIPAFATYVAGYVPEVIRSTDPVRIRFAQPAIPDSLAGTVVAADLYQMAPKTEGKATWEDVYTFRFTPAAPFASGSKHRLTIALGRIFPDAPPEIKTVRFDFSVRPLDLALSLESPMLSDEDPALYIVTGQVRSSEKVTASALEQTVSATYPHGRPDLKWTHSEDGRVHRFTIANIQRAEADQELAIALNGKSVNSPSASTSRVSIPGRNTFKVIDVHIMQDGIREIRIVFSDFLKPTGDLIGLVLINGSDKAFSLKRNKHILSLFPDQEISGNFTVYVDAAIVNHSGKRLGSAQTFELSFTDIPPQVELIGKGNIVPSSGAVILPFRAVNLNAVDVEVFEIFENNVMQFLQYGDLWYAGGYEATGRVVGTHVVDLNALYPDPAGNQWNRYAIDLSHYTNLRQGSIYEVRIGFQKSYARVACAEETADPQAPRDQDESLWHYYYDYDSYRYANREDPCKNEYYTADHFVRRNILASNLGLAAKGGDNGVFQVFVHDLRTTDALSGCNIKLYDFQQQLIGESQTDAEGRCILKPDRSPAFVIAEYRGEKGYLKVTDGAALSVSDFDISGTTAQKGIRGFIYGDRDIWRPGDTLFLNFVLQSAQKASADHPVTCVVYNPRGQKYFEHTTQRHVGPVYHFPVATSVSDLTGNWRMEILVGGVKFNKTLKIETIKPNRLKINIDTDGPINAWDGKTVIPLDVSWLHGSPAGGLDARVELGLQQGQFSFQGFQEYRFDDPTRTTSLSISTIFDGKLDADGHASVSIPIDQQTLYPGKMIANLKTRVFEKGGDFSTDQFSTDLWPYRSYVGLSIAQNRWGYKQLESGANNTIKVAAVDTDGKGLAKRQVSVGVYHADWHWWWNQDNYELAQFNSAQHLGAFITDTLTTDNKGRADFAFRPTGYGLYLIRVCDTESGHCSGDFAYSGYFYGEEDGRTAAAKLTLTVDRESYAPGDDVEITIPSSPGSRVIISLENETDVLSTHALTANGDLTKYVFKATREMAPNIYAHIQLIQPHNGGTNDMPIRMYGVVPVMVEDPATRLQPVITMPDALKPEQTFAIDIHEANKKPMAYTIAIVDEGLLDLTRFKTPNPWSYFFAKRALGVKSWDLYDLVLGGLGGEVERILAIGGDGSNVQIQAINEVNRFKPVVVHLGPFYLKAGERASHQITMPNYVGSVRAMVVASGDGRYGSAEKTVKVKSPLMLLASMPRVLSPGEEIAIPVNVFAMEDDIRNVEITIRGDKHVSIRGAATSNTTFDRQGDQLVVFNAEVSQSIGASKIIVEARSGREKATTEIEIAIRNPNPVITEVSEFVVEKGSKWTGKVVDVGMAGTNENAIEISGLFPANLAERMRYLIRYPYGCLEQTTSTAFPQLYVDQLIALSPEERTATQHHVRAAVDKISKYVNPSGGFSYWPGVSDVHEWTNNYTGHFLVEAQRAGFYVNPDILSHWTTYQASRTRQFNVRVKSPYELMTQAYRLYTLALAGNPEIGAMNRLRNASALTSTSKFMLGASYALIGQTDVAQTLITSDATVDNYTTAGQTLGSSTRDRALIVESLLACGKEEMALAIVKRIADEMGSDRWYSTQTTAFALIAMSKFAKVHASNELYFAIQTGSAQRLTVRQPKVLYQKRLRSTDAGDITVENLMEAPLYVRVIRTGQPLEPVSKSAQSHLSARVVYQDMQGKPINPESLSQGTDFIMAVTIANPGTLAGDLEDVALQTLLPDGWELINQRLNNLGDRFKSSTSAYQDIRDDRVYTFFDLEDKGSKTFYFALNAAYVGRFILPAIRCEGMYDHAVSATIPGGWVEVKASSIKIAKASVTGE